MIRPTALVAYGMKDVFVLPWALVAVVVMTGSNSGPNVLRGDEPRQANQGREAPQPSLPSYMDYSRRISQALRREATAKTGAERAVAVSELCQLFRQIVRDPRYVTSPTLQGHKAVLSARLRRIRDDLQRQMARQRPTARSRGQAGTSDALDDEAISLGVSETVELAHQSLGGPPVLLGSVSMSALLEDAFGGAGVWDYGPALVELIQRTIVPSFWDVNGGPGTIIYYRPAMALVVRATPGMFLEVGGALDRLRGR
jgi:hypothetical protein